MMIDQIRRLMSGGFRPFVIRTSDGRDFTVPHPEFIMVGRQSVAILDARGEIDNIAGFHIASIKELAIQEPGEK